MMSALGTRPACKNYAKYKEVKSKGVSRTASDQVKAAMEDGLDKAFAGF